MRAWEGASSPHLTPPAAMASKGPCVICKEPIVGYGNNPDPVVDYSVGRCCDKCNFAVVVPERMRAAGFAHAAAAATAAAAADIALRVRAAGLPPIDDHTVSTERLATLYMLQMRD